MAVWRLFSFLLSLKSTNASTKLVNNACIIKEQGNEYVAMSAIELVISNAQKDRIEAVIASMGFDLEYVLSISHADAAEIKEELQYKKHLKELALAKASYAKQNEIRKQLEVIDGELSSIGSSKPLLARVFVKVFAKEPTAMLAYKQAVANAESLANELAGIEGVECKMLKGKELEALT